MIFVPSYTVKYRSGEFKQRIHIADKILRSCTSCPRNCNVDRTSGEYGICQSGDLPVVSSYTPHFGEEPVLSGTRGAGNIFFGNCNLRCVFCQNYVISQNYKVERRNEVSHERLAEIMIELQDRDCHNIGLVSPTHFTVPILKSIYLAVEKGLKLPIIYNTNGYDSVEMLRLYDGIIDIYLPDFKWGENSVGKTYSRVSDYFDKVKPAIKEMYRQVGSELVYEDGVVVRGLIIRHLVMPNSLAETENVFRFISEELDKQVHISLMAQYYPSNKAENYPLISRNISYSEYARAIELLDKFGLENGWVQEMESKESYRPFFEETRDDPFKNNIGTR
ncbi:MAG TPA: radical SAM protein [Ignavibacteriaceae bacterium]